MWRLFLSPGTENTSVLCYPPNSMKNKLAVSPLLVLKMCLPQIRTGTNQLCHCYQSSAPPRRQANYYCQSSTATNGLHCFLGCLVLTKSRLS